MAIYRMVGEKKDRLEAIPGTSFIQEGIKEDPDLRYTLRAQPEAIEDGLFILSEEFSNWQGSGRSIDLLGLDASGRLVVVELKRTNTADHAELQAIRYAAMVANITFERAIESHKAYLEKWGSQEDAAERIREHLANTESGEMDTERPRIILVSGGFSTELTTSVLWLNDSYGLDIKCIRLQLYRNGPELLVETNQVIPLPEARDYQVRFRERENEVQKHRSEPGGRWDKGGEEFEKNIQNAPESIQAGLKQLYAWATGLEQEGIVSLSSWMGNSLALTVPDESALVSISINGSVRFWPNSFRRMAPRSLAVVSELIRADIASSQNPVVRALSRITTDLLDALTTAYREASGLPVDGEDGGDGE